MIDRKKFAEELTLREQIRKAVAIVKSKRERKILSERKQNSKLRSIIRELIVEASAVATTAKHNNTGINTLEDLLKNTNILSVLSQGYKSLTTKTEDDAPTGPTVQRNSYRNHILAAVARSLAPEKSRKQGAGDITEDVDIEIGGRPEDDPAFIDVDPEERSDEEVAKEDFTIAGEDKTGRNKAFTDFDNIEKVILTAFDNLDNITDLDLFDEYLIKNLALYFDTFETELSNEVEAPPEAAEAEPNLGGAAAEAEEVDAGEEAANIELQELLVHLDIDDIIKNLL